MNLKSAWSKLKSAITKKAVWQSEKDSHAVVPAFVCGGVEYFEIPGVFNLPYRRGLSAASIYEEVQMRVTREYLLAYIADFEQTLSDPTKINILSITKQFNELKDRVNWIVSPESIYKLASVVYFDKNESIYDYNGEYAIQKIKHWNKYKVGDFFLQEPIKKYIPHSELQESDLVTYITTALKVEKEQALSLLQKLSKTHSTENFYKTLQSLHNETLVS